MNYDYENTGPIAQIETTDNLSPESNDAYFGDSYQSPAEAEVGPDTPHLQLSPTAAPP